MELPVAQRFVALENGHNFRDIGGYPTKNGKFVRRGQVYRSGQMAHVSDADKYTLNELAIRRIIDLRANDERIQSPTLWHLGSDTELWSRDHASAAGAILGARFSDNAVKSDLRSAMLGIYRNIPTEQADSYHVILSSISQRKGKIVFNCSAGKDRTGVAAALLLEILGVSRELIFEDYLLSNQKIDGLIHYMQSLPKYHDLMSIDIDQLMPLMRAERDYLETSFDVIEGAYGSVANYVTDVLKIDLIEQDAIREVLLH